MIYCGSFHRCSLLSWGIFYLILVFKELYFLKHELVSWIVRFSQFQFICWYDCVEFLKFFLSVNVNCIDFKNFFKPMFHSWNKLYLVIMYYFSFMITGFNLLSIFLHLCSWDILVCTFLYLWYLWFAISSVSSLMEFTGLHLGQPPGTMDSGSLKAIK